VTCVAQPLELIGSTDCKLCAGLCCAEFLAHFVHEPSQGPISIPPDGMRDEGGDVVRSGSLAGGSSDTCSSVTSHSSSEGQGSAREDAPSDTSQ
jgi:hypothetical protein